VITNPPKKMPSNGGEKVPAPAPKQVRINTTPSAPFAPATPNVEVVPPSTPNLDADRRDPF